MKKILATLALFALAGCWTTQTTHASSDIWDKYCNDSRAMKGTYVTLTCKFGTALNSYCYSADGKDVTDDIPLLGIGEYDLTLPHTTLKKNHKYAFVMQKTEGGNGPNFQIEAKAEGRLFYEWKAFGDLKDHELYTGSFELSGDIIQGTPTFIEGFFGSHISGTETIAGYIRDLEA